MLIKHNSLDFAGNIHAGVQKNFVPLQSDYLGSVLGSPAREC